MAESNIKITVSINQKEINRCLRAAQKSADKLIRLYQKYLARLMYEQLKELASYD